VLGWEILLYSESEASQPEVLTLPDFPTHQRKSNEISQHRFVAIRSF